MLYLLRGMKLSRAWQDGDVDRGAFGVVAQPKFTPVFPEATQAGESSEPHELDLSVQNRPRPQLPGASTLVVNLLYSPDTHSRCGNVAEFYEKRGPAYAGLGFVRIMRGRW